MKLRSSLLAWNFLRCAKEIKSLRRLCKNIHDSKTCEICLKFCETTMFWRTPPPLPPCSLSHAVFFFFQEKGKIKVVNSKAVSHKRKRKKAVVISLNQFTTFPTITLVTKLRHFLVAKISCMCSMASCYLMLKYILNRWYVLVSVCQLFNLKYLKTVYLTLAKNWYENILRVSI